MKFKITWYDNYFSMNMEREDIEEHSSLEELLDNIGIPEEHFKEVIETIEKGVTVVYDECGDKTFDPQFHSQDDWVFKVEEIKKSRAKKP